MIFFLFESRKGVCVHFASAMVILARACGLPARYVEGYVADEKDPETGLYLVREKDVKNAVEVYDSALALVRKCLGFFKSWMI